MSDEVPETGSDAEGHLMRPEAGVVKALVVVGPSSSAAAGRVLYFDSRLAKPIRAKWPVGALRTAEDVFQTIGVGLLMILQKQKQEG